MKLRTNIMPQACFGSPQARLWRGLRASWACLRRNLDALGELLDSLGCLCAVSWPPFGCFLGALGRIWALIGASVLDFGWSWAPPGWVLASSGAVFATIFEGDALIAAGIPAWHSHWHFVTSLQRGGTCAAHGMPPKAMSQQTCIKLSKRCGKIRCFWGLRFLRHSMCCARTAALQGGNEMPM